MARTTSRTIGLKRSTGADPLKEQEEKATAIRLDRERKKEDQIDRHMAAARETLKSLEQEDDPYAMHKTVESLPTWVLLNVIGRKDHLDIQE